MTQKRFFLFNGTLSPERWIFLTQTVGGGVLDFPQSAPNGVGTHQMCPCGTLESHTIGPLYRHHASLVTFLKRTPWL